MLHAQQPHASFCFVFFNSNMNMEKCPDARSVIQVRKSQKVDSTHLNAVFRKHQRHMICQCYSQTFCHDSVLDPWSAVVNALTDKHARTQGKWAGPFSTLSKQCKWQQPFCWEVCTHVDLCKFMWQFTNHKWCIIHKSCKPQLFLTLMTMTTESFISTQLVDHLLLFVLLTPSPRVI